MLTLSDESSISDVFALSFDLDAENSVISTTE